MNPDKRVALLVQTKAVKVLTTGTSDPTHARLYRLADEFEAIVEQGTDEWDDETRELFSRLVEVAVALAVESAEGPDA